MRNLSACLPNRLCPFCLRIRTELYEIQKQTDDRKQDQNTSCSNEATLSLPRECDRREQATRKRKARSIPQIVGLISNRGRERIQSELVVCHTKYSSSLSGDHTELDRHLGASGFYRGRYVQYIVVTSRSGAADPRHPTFSVSISAETYSTKIPIYSTLPW